MGLREVARRAVRAELRAAAGAEEGERGEGAGGGGRGEEEAREVLDTLGLIEEEPDPTAPDMDPKEPDMDPKEPGCSAAGGASAGLLLPFPGLLGALGLRRRG